jgi:formylglycine-generating enzyme required for sulfatase activity
MQIIMRSHVSSNLALVLAMAAFSLAGPAEEKPVEAKAYPLWDGKEVVAKYAKRAGLEPAVTLDLGDGVKMEFVLIPAGKFVMGSPKDEEGKKDHDRLGKEVREEPQHEVTIGKPLYMGKFEVTQEQYEKLVGKNPSAFKGAKNPVEIVYWDDAKDFCKRMSVKTGRVIRLPSEAEWEYACRAGSTTPYHPPRELEKSPPLTDAQRRRVEELISKLGSEELAVRDKATQDLIALGSRVLPLLDDAKAATPEAQFRLASVKSAGLKGVAWFVENRDQKTHPVGEKEPNAFGLHDMHGNACEWCEDDLHYDYIGTPTDGSAWIDTPRGDRRVFRGGSCNSDAKFCRSACRNGGTWGSFICGIRVVLSSSSPRGP